jgi:hypothetical protein
MHEPNSGQLEALGCGCFSLGVTVLSFAFVFIPACLIQPSSPRIPAISVCPHALKQWSPILTLLALLAALAIAYMLWRRTRRWWGKAAIVLVFAPLLLTVWFARQNHFEWMFRPLPNASFVSAKAVDFVHDNELVLAIEINGDAVAFPVRQIAYHHVVQEVVGGKPVVATY